MRNGRFRASKKSTAAKLSSSLRVSTSTTAPIAPRTKSSHMNQNRRCPGVPNRYSTRSSSSVIRPKSIATVVVRLSGVASTMSTPADASVTIASVRSGMISETAPTNVVLPTPNPPAMTIFVEAVADCASKCSKATQGPSYEFVALVAGRSLVQRSMHPKVAGDDQVADQDARNTNRQIQPGRDFRDRRALGAQLDDPVVYLVGWPAVRQPCLQRLHRRFQG